jgi:hypothetical protein
MGRWRAGEEPGGAGSEATECEARGETGWEGRGGESTHKLGVRSSSSRARGAGEERWAGLGRARKTMRGNPNPLSLHCPRIYAARTCCLALLDVEALYMACAHSWRPAAAHPALRQ